MYMYAITLYKLTVYFILVYDFQEQKKIMFYHPSNISVDMQTRHIGLCMGVIMFTE